MSLAEKVRRRQMLEGLQEGIAAEINAGLLGRTVEVLVEGRKKGRWRGRTRTDKLVFFEDEADRFGRLVDVEIKHTGPVVAAGKRGGIITTVLSFDLALLVLMLYTQSRG